MPDPNRDTPNAETALPQGAQLRKDNELPKCTKSKNDMDDPNRVAPNIETVLLTRANCRKDNELPR